MILLSQSVVGDRRNCSIFVAANKVDLLPLPPDAATVRLRGWCTFCVLSVY